MLNGFSFAIHSDCDFGGSVIGQLAVAEVLPARSRFGYLRLERITAHESVGVPTTCFFRRKSWAEFDGCASRNGWTIAETR
jgi:hypothetical protein